MKRPASIRARHLVGDVTLDDDNQILMDSMAVQNHAFR
jgi:hypothetical protein